jgi:hypothetical protein
MYKNFNLTESEREEILKQHQSHGYKKPLNEMDIPSSPSGNGNMVKKLMDYFGFKKEMERTLDDGRFIEGYGNGVGKYQIKVILTKKGETDIAKIMYDGPEFGNPEKMVKQDLTFDFFQKEWIPVVVGDERFPKGLEKSLKHIKNIKNYNESSSI